MSLGSICTNALRELSGFEIPASFYGNTNLTARTCVALVRREAMTLERTYRWSELIDTYTLSTVEGQDSYDLPSDYRAFANQSHWDRTKSRPMIGPASGAEWQWLKGYLAAGATIDRWWRLQGTKFYIHPVPTNTGDTIAFDYYSKNWVTKQSDNSNTSDWTSDNDTSRLDEELLTAGLKWRFLQAKGMPFEPEYKEYETLVEHAQADNGGKRKITLGPTGVIPTKLPDRGFGPPG